MKHRLLTFLIPRMAMLLIAMIPISAFSVTSLSELIPLSGEISIKNPEILRYNKDWLFPDLQIEFLNPELQDLTKYTDYYISVDRTYEVGPVTITVTGRGKYSGQLSVTGEILKGIISPSEYVVQYPDNTFDGLEKRVNVYGNNGLSAKVSYKCQSLSTEHGRPAPTYDENGMLIAPFPFSVETPIYPGMYEVIASFEETAYYESADEIRIGWFEIFPVNSQQVEKFLQLIRDHWGSIDNYLIYSEPEESAMRYSNILKFRNNGEFYSINLSGFSSDDYYKPDYPYIEEETYRTRQFPYFLFNFPSLRELNLASCNIAGRAEDIRDFFENREEYEPSEEGIFSRGLWVLNLEDNRISGRISDLLSAFPELQELNVSHNSFSELGEIGNFNIQELDYSDQVIGEHINLDLTSISYEELMNSLPSLLFRKSWWDMELWQPMQLGMKFQYLPYPDAEIERDPHYFLRYDHGSESDPMILNLYLDFSSLPNVKVQSVDISGRQVYTGSMQPYMRLYISEEYPVYFPQLTILAKLSLLPYDINFDFKINVADVQAISNYILIGHSPYFSNRVNATAADLNHDNKVNAMDLVGYINHLLQFAPPASFSDVPEKRILRANEIENQLVNTCGAFVEHSDGKLVLVSECDFAAIDIQVDHGDLSSFISCLKEYGLNVIEREIGTASRVMAYSSSGSALPAGRYIVCDSDNSILEGISLSDPNANDLPVVERISTSANAHEPDDMEISRRDAVITILSAAQSEWRIFSMSGILLASGKTKGEQTDIDISAFGNDPLILTVSNSTTTTTRKL